ncbi:T-cell immunomodulatory protein [Toxorhynchites rutilus septentrionalis]|uniref:T-cell immunomodulatory protein n=1 Tax=Toxorhynchites rutilus septentrionalis TaxID=329112 RepID=UPI0024785C40|nr:T-cell immunomodulatory protein [Toxorhynchites rutilus septentrionalis]
MKLQFFPVTQVLSGLLLLFGFGSSRVNGGDIIDITDTVFGSMTDTIPVAYGDFNSDELFDVFVLRDNFRTIQILFGSDDKPLLQAGPKCEYKNFHITSVVPGDFDGDAYMDVMFTVKNAGDNQSVYINWGGSEYMNCTGEDEKPIIVMKGQPLALDYDKDFIIDLFGLSTNDTRQFWVFKKPKDGQRLPPDVIGMEQQFGNLKVPHSHAIIDLDKDFTADLFLTTTSGYEVWKGTESEKKFEYSHKIQFPIGNYDAHLGQSIFLDIELDGRLMQIVPICFNKKCSNSSILVRHGSRFDNLQIDFKDDHGDLWGFVVPNPSDWATQVITLRGGDFNLDGYPDLLATLSKSAGQMQTFLLENVPCEKVSCNHMKRTFVVRWRALAPFANGTIMGSFYDFYNDGVLDAIFVEKAGNTTRPVAFRNSLDYDANFVKVIVLTGLSNRSGPKKLTPLGRKKRTYGTNLPGPRIEYNTTTQDGDPQHGASAQLPQSAYFSLGLPYTTFGLGRTPNFVDSLTVGLSNHSRTWTQLIPNSQMIVVPRPIDEADKWKAQLFVTPSKLILMSVVALGGICLVILLLILILYAKEKREDKIQRSLEAHRFHFDAM